MHSPAAALAVLPSPQLNWSLFLDFDGTLTRLAEHPDAIKVEDHLVDMLEKLTRYLGGAVAVVSGRPLSQIDRFLAPLRMAGAGKHGIEHRLPGGLLLASPGRPEALQRVKQRLAAAIAADERLLLEDKEQTLAVHFRRAPEREAAVRDMVTAALQGECGFEVLNGKMVLEIKPCGSDKGVAIENLMHHPVFAGRVPVFAGDDVTDEDGFRAVNAMQGISVHVGAAKDTAAHYCVPDVDAFLAWLEDLTAAFAAAARKS